MPTKPKKAASTTNLNKLKIKNVDLKNKKEFPDPPFPVLPKHAFLTLIVAPPGSGKTNLLCYMIMNLYQKYFHRIVVCSTTIDNDDKWWTVREKKNLIIENKPLMKILEGKVNNKSNYKIVHKNESELQMNNQADKEKFDGKIDGEDLFVHIDQLYPVIEEQQNMIEYLAEEKDMGKDAKYVADRLLVILDDQAGNFSTQTNTKLNNFVIRHRHYSASVIVVSQVYKAVPKVIRYNAQQLLLFEIGNKEELREIYKERGDMYSEEEWLQMYKYCISEPFAFMYFNSKFPRGHRFYKGFETPLESSKDLPAPPAPPQMDTNDKKSNTDPNTIEDESTTPAQ